MPNRYRGSTRTTAVAVVVVVAVLVTAGYLIMRGSGSPSRVTTTQAATETPDRVELAAKTADGRTAPAGSTDSAAAGDASRDVLASALDGAEKKAERKADREIIGIEVRRTLNEFWKAEDTVFESMPRYEDVRDEYRKKAEELLRPIDPADTKAITSLAQGEIDAFWDNGSLESAASYEHGYLARALMELAVEREPDNYQRLTFLKEAIATMTPMFFAGPKMNTEGYKALWPVVDKQKQLIMEGKVPVSPEAMLAMNDWTYLVGRATEDKKAAVDGWQWLVDNADNGGWGKVKHLFAKGLEYAKKDGSGFGFNLYACPNDIKDGKPDYTELTRHGRRLSSLQGSKWYREHAVRVWEEYDRLSHGPE